VIWKGDKLIDGVPETLDLLRSKVCFDRFADWAIFSDSPRFLADFIKDCRAKGWCS
jgi:hypothetical protein